MFVHVIVHRINQDGQRYFELLGEILGDFSAVFQRLRIFDKDVIALVLRYLPAVSGMGLADINDVEMSFVFVVGVQFFDRTDRLAKRRSGTTTKDQHNRLSFQVCQFDRLFRFYVL